MPNHRNSAQRANPFSDEVLDAEEAASDRQLLGQFRQGQQAPIQRQRANPNPFSNEVLDAEESASNQQLMDQFRQEQRAAQLQPVQPQPTQPQQQDNDSGFFASIGEAITGDKRSTPEIEALDEIGLNVPEMRQLSVASLQSLAGLLITSDQGELENILQSALPDAKFKRDSKGNRSIVLPSGEYALNKPGFSSGDFARGIFDALAFFPGTAIPARLASGGARIGAIAAANAGTDVLLQAGTQGLGGGNRLDPARTALAAVGGAGGQLVSDAVGAGFRANRQFSPETQQLIDASKREDVPVFTSDINEGGFIQTVSQTSESFPLIGRRAERLNQRSQRIKALEDFNDSLPVVTSKDIFESLQKNKGTLNERAGRTMNQIETQMDAQGLIDLTPVLRQIDESIAVLRQPAGTIDNNSIEMLQGMRRKMTTEASRPFKFSDLRNERSMQRQAVDSIVPASETQLRSQGKSQISQVVTKMGKVLDDFVESNGQPRQLQRYKKANIIFNREARKLKDSTLKKVLDQGGSKPELVDNLIISQTPSDATNLMRSLSVEGRNNVRAAVIQGMVKRSFIDGVLSPTEFSKQIRKRNDNLEVIFGKGTGSSNFKRLKGMELLFKETAKSEKALQSSGAANAAATSLAIQPNLTNLATIISLTSKITGITNILESEKIRNLLLKLGDNPSNPSRLVTAINAEIIGASQGAVRQDSTVQEPK